MTDLIQMGEKAQLAKRVLSIAPKSLRERALQSVADALRAHIPQIVAENQLDLEAGREAGLSKALLDRLSLDEKRIIAIAKSVEDIISLPDPLDRVLSEDVRPNGLRLTKVVTPIGVIAVIYEARPNVTVDSAALCLKSGNVVILRGGKEAFRSNTVIANIMREAVAQAGLPEDCIQLVGDTSRETATQLMRLNGYVDLLIPRGGQGLIKSVVSNSTVPVIETGAGVCHTYIDKDADLDMAVSVLVNAKTSRPSVCNACECALVHRDVAARFLPLVKPALDEKQVEIRGDETVCAIIPGCTPASDSDWGKEYNDYILAVKVVDSFDAAIDHIYRYSTMHSECIITDNEQTAEEFLTRIDAAAVYVNASTRFTDGGEFGFGAEIGISTQKLHARGPLGLNELTSYKYLIRGNGQIR